MNFFKTIHILFFCIILHAQENEPIVDSLYREDQFYANLTYNLLQDKPTNFNQYSFSSGINFGFLRDMPISKNRHWALAIGLGYSYNNIKQNIKIEEDNNLTAFSIEPNFESNRLILNYAEIPFEIRWRNSSYESHKFWRIYTGFKMSYLLNDKAVFESTSEKITLKSINETNKFQYGTYLCVGYNSVNVYAYYALNPIFKNASINGDKLNLKSFNLGFMFYIL